MTEPSVLFVDHRAPFWERMSQNYRHRHERIAQAPGVDYIDAFSSGFELQKRQYDILLAGVFGFALHPLFPPHGRLPDLAFGRARQACLMLVDLHDTTFVGGWQAMCRYLNRHFDYLISSYDCEELATIRRGCPRLRRCYVLPHHIDTTIYRDYGLKKRWDILLYGHLEPRFRYPFRNRLFPLVQSSGLNVKFVEYPDKGRVDANRCGEALARLINQSRIAIATSAHCDYLLEKYFEISACRCVVAGNMASAGESIWQDDFVRLEPSMPDEEIVARLKAALADRERVQAMADCMYRRIHEGYSLDRFVEKLLGILGEIAQDRAASSAMRTTGRQK